MTDGCLSVPVNRWHCSPTLTVGAVSPGPARLSGTMTRAPDWRDIVRLVAIARTAPAFCRPRPGECRPQRVETIHEKCDEAHRGSLTRLQWGSGIKNKLKSRSHLLSVSQSGGNVEARARCDCVTCGMSGQNDRTELFWIYGDGDNLVSLHAPAPAMHWTRGLTMMQKELPRWNLFIEFLEII